MCYLMALGTRCLVYDMSICEWHVSPVRLVLNNDNGKRIAACENSNNLSWVNQLIVRCSRIVSMNPGWFMSRT